MTTIWAMLGCAILAGSAVSAQTFLERDRVDVPIYYASDTTFEVVRSSFSAPADIWCAAGAYAERVLGQRRGQLWVAQGLAPSPTETNRKSMVFSTAPVAPETTTYSYSLNTAGVVKSLGAARGACDPLGTVVYVRTEQGSFRAF